MHASPRGSCGVRGGSDVEGYEGQLQSRKVLDGVFLFDAALENEDGVFRAERPGARRG